MREHRSGHERTEADKAEGNTMGEKRTTEVGSGQERRRFGSRRWSRRRQKRSREEKNREGQERRGHERGRKKRT